MARYEVAGLFGTHAAETILASVHVRAHQQAEHMDASDLVKTPQKHLARRGPSTYGLTTPNSPIGEIRQGAPGPPAHPCAELECGSERRSCRDPFPFRRLPRDRRGRAELAAR